MKSSTYLFLIAIIFSLILKSSEGRGIWGARRKRDEVEQNEVENDGSFAPPIKPASFEATKRRFESKASDEIAGALPSRDQILNGINLYIEMMEKVITAPEFESMVTTEAIKNMVNKIPALSANPEISALLESEQFSDPAVLKQTVIQGISSVREYANQFADILSDPAQINELIAQLPAEMKDIVTGMMSGDFSKLKTMISNIPGLDRSQRKLLNSMLDFKSNPSAMKDSLNEVLSDPSQIETARLQMLNNPAMAQMLGIPEDVLNVLPLLLLLLLLLLLSLLFY